MVWLCAMHVVMQALVELQTIEFGPDSESSAVKDAAEKLRAKVPPQILGHYDRLRARGKKGLALVRDNRVCAECHMQVPVGVVGTVMKGEDIQLCGNCGRYLFVLEKPVEPTPAAAPAPPKPARKPRKKAPANVGGSSHPG
jgi:predicted  nucleic acid-binding Zn-ribbon protein